MSPRMFIVAGPPGSGKSTAFPVSGFGVDFFNADDRAAALNQGSYLNISRAIREQVNRLFEAFVADHIERRVSCAFETTLRSGITFEQAAAGRKAGFVIEMRYLAPQDFEMHLERIKMRADMGRPQRAGANPARHLRCEPCQSCPRHPRNGLHQRIRQRPLGNGTRRGAAGRAW